MQGYRIRLNIGKNFTTQLDMVRFKLSIIKKYNLFKSEVFKIVFIIVALFAFSQAIAKGAKQFPSPAPNSIVSDSIVDLDEAEHLWGSIDFKEMQKEINSSLNLSVMDGVLFWDYLQDSIYADQIRFLNNYKSVSISGFPQYIANLTQSYIKLYSYFQTIKTAYTQQQAEQNALNSAQATYGPCTNMDFTDGLNGWTVKRGTASTRGWTNGGTFPAPSGVTTGQASPPRVNVTSAGGTDPYIPSISVTPGASYPNAVMIEDYLNGAHASEITQTFAVTASNSLLIYKYAIVLESPNHSHKENPYFTAVLTVNGVSVSCVQYSSIADPNVPADIAGFTYAPNTPNPYRNSDYVFSSSKINLYYKDWTTVAIPLDKYIGQNATITFTTADCSLGGHRGYAYVWAECSSINTISSTNSICYPETLTFSAPAGFKTYEWTGPNLVGATNTSSVQVNNPGVYKLILTPLYDSSTGSSPCYDTITFDVLEHCSPSPITKTICETTAGSGNATGVDLTSYNTAITAYNSAATVQGWYSGTPPSAGNKIATPTNVTVSNGSKYYAVITYPSLGIGGDTAQLNFVVNSLATVNAGGPQSVCANNNVVTLNGTVTTASGGTWTTNGTGTFANPNLITTTYTPSATDISNGSVNLTLTSTGNNTGCSAVTNTATITITALPTVNAGGNQTVCANNDKVTLNGSYTSGAGVTGVVWTTTGSGTFANKNSAATTYTPSAADASAGSVTLTLSTVSNGNPGSCSIVSNSMTLTITAAPVVTTSNPQTLCGNNALATISGTVNAPFTATWSTSGTGTFGNGNQLNTTYTPSAADITSGNVTLTLTSGNNGNCTAVTSNTTITYTAAPKLTATAATNACSNNPAVTLTSSVSGGATGVQWSNGNGTYFPNTTSLTPQYTATAAEINAGGLEVLVTTTGNGNCKAVTDTVFVIFFPAPVVNAGTGSNVCANNSAIKLNGSVTNSPNTTTWSGGTGTFNPNANSLTATYTPSATEISAGTVTLTLTAAKTGCTNVSNNVTYSISPTPVVSAGPNQSVCSNNAVVTLNGSVTNATGGQWTTSGTGTFANPTSLNTTYTPSGTDISNGSVILTLTSTGNDNGKCTPVSSSATITFTPSPTVTPTTTTPTVCANNATISLSYSTTIATGAVWSSSGTGGFSPSNSATSVTYTPSAADTAAGTITFTVTSTGNGDCNAVTASIPVTITPAPTVNPGAAQKVCANNSLVNLKASYTVATGVLWSGGNGSFGSNTSAVTTYSPTVSEILNGSVTLTLTSTGNGLCNPVSTNLPVTIIAAPGANAGSDQVICATNNTVSLNGSVLNSPGGGVWTTTGSGTFSPSASTLNATYTASSSDISTGKIDLILKTTGNSLCKEESDTMTVSFTVAPAVNAGPNQTVCTNDYPVQLAGTGSPATWTTSGSGTFSPNNTTLNATYLPSSADSVAGSVTLTLTSIPSGACPTVKSTVKITIPPGPVVNAGPDQNICGNTGTVQLNGSVKHAGGGSWTSTGTGTFNSNTALNAIYTASAADIAAGSVKLILQSTGSAPCTTERDTMVVTFTPPVTVNAGPNQTYCADVTSIPLNGSATGASATWSTSGSGTIANPANLVTTYAPSSADTAAKSVTLTLTTSPVGACPAFTSNVTFTFTPAPTVNAGANQTICSDASSVKLNGTVTVAAGQIWTSTGTGTFSPDATVLNPTYVLSAADSALSSITFTLTTTGNGTCNTYSAKSVITITPKPVANAGGNQTICADAGSVTLTGTASNASSTTWSTSGSGTFNPNATSVNTSYVPSAADIKAGTVTLTLTANGNGVCINPSTSQMFVTITPAPTVNAGNDITVCANDSATTLNGSITVASGATWSGGAGTYNPDANTLNAIYIPSASEIAAGSVTLTLTTTGNGTCKPKTDQVVITIAPSPVVSAGSANTTICADSSYIALNGSVSNAAGGLWTTSGTGSFFPNDATLNAKYVPSTTDTAAGTVTLTLTSQGNGACNAVSSAFTVTINPAPTVSAGSNQTVCADTSGVQLNGTITNAGGGQWTSSGSGAFVPNATTLNAQYVPSATDIAVGSVTLTLTTTGNGLCKAISSSMVITINPAPTISAGPDQTICADASSVSLNGKETVSPGAVWSTNGTGVFLPNNTTLNATYEPSPADTSSRGVKLTLTSTGNGLCKAVTSSMNLTINPAPIISAGGNQSVCANNSIVSLNGSIFNAGGVAWTTSGTGTFTPDPDTAVLQYYPTPADIRAGSITLKVTSQNNGLCKAVTDSAVITITPAPTVNAGTDTTICTNSTFVPLHGQYTVVDSILWLTSGSGTFSPDANTANAYYLPSASDVVSGSVTLTLTSLDNKNCLAVTSKKVITLNSPPTANAGQDQTICADLASISLNGTVKVATGGQWTSSGTGTFTPNNTTLNATYTPSAADQTNGNIVLTLTTTGNGVCPADSSQMDLIITPIPVVNAGSNQSICSDAAGVTLNGTVVMPSGEGQQTNGASIVWSTNGTGTFSPGADTVNTSYIPSAADISAGSVTLTLRGDYGTCNPVSSSLTVSITTAPTVSAGPPQTICANTSAMLNGSFTGATGATWSTASGTGTFLPNANTLNATFIPSAHQISNGKATLTLTTSGSGICNAASSTVVITITPAPTINAGSDLTVCTGLDSIPLNASVTVATGGTWSTVGTASGTFTPSVNSLKAYYHPSASDFTAGSIQLAIVSTGNGTCIAVNDTMNLSFSPAPPISAGPDQTVCTTNFPVQLAGSGNTGVWSGGGGTFFPNDSSLTALYTPSATEISNGSVTLTLTTISSGGCLPGSDQVTITIEPGPTVNPGNDTIVCSNTTGIKLNGQVTISPAARWSTDGGGTFTPNDSTLNATYIPSASDITDGSVILTLTSIDNGICKGVNKDMTITFDSLPTVNAGANQLVCANTASVNLTGKVTHSSNVLWSGGNGGTFTNANSLNASYSPSAADASAGSVTLTLTALSDGVCNNVSNTTTISFGSLPTASVGNPDTNVCASSVSVPLLGSVTTSTGGTWTTNGTGTFSPNANTLNVNYIPTAADTAAHSVVLTLTTIPNGTCPSATATKTVNFAPVPTVSAGTNTTACANASSFNITGTFSNASGVQWSTSGSGVFTSGGNTTNATYQPSATDKSSGITLSLTTTAGVCPSVSSNVLINFVAEPTVNAGGDQKLCVDVTAVDLVGNVTNAGGGQWQTLGSGTITNPDSLNATYAPSAADIAAKSVKLVLQTTGTGVCTPVTDTMMIKFTPAPTVSAGSPQTVCADTAYIQLSGSMTISTQGAWTTNGTGTFSPDADELSLKYYPSNADTAAHSVKFILTTTDNGTCNPRKDSIVVTIQPIPTVNAGTGQELCASVTSINLSGTVKGAPGVIWATTGSGTITSPTSAVTTYSPSNADKAAKEVSLSLTSQGGLCKPVTSYITYTFSPTPAAIVDAGFDQSVCIDVTSVPLDGVIKYAGGGVWSTGLNGVGIKGTGTFSPADSILTGNYLPSAADKASGKVHLRLTSTHNGVCNPVTDSITVTFTPAPTITLSANSYTICADTAGITLNGNAVTVAGGVKWTTSGSGEFTPDAELLNGFTYVPSAADIAAQKVALTLTTTDNGTCNARDTSVTIRINPIPVVSAGANQTVCSNTASVALKGSVKNSQAGNTNLWTTSGTGTFTSSSALTTSYLPSAADAASGRISLTLTSSGNGTCKPEQNEIDISFSPLPVVNAGPDTLEICADNPTVNLAGTIKHATGGVWSSLGSGVFAKADSLKTTYTAFQADITAGKVKLVLTSTGNGVCQAITDTTLIEIAPKPIVTVASAVTCVYNGGDTLTGTVTNATGGVWTSSGSGEFSPDETALNVVYYPSAADKATGDVTITLTSQGNGTCNAVSANLGLIVSPPPIANAGTTRYICEDSTTVLTAVSSSNVHYLWKALTGTIVTSPDTLDYAKVEINQTQGKFVLTVTDNKKCFSRDTVIVNPVKPVTFNMAKHYCFSDTLVLDALPNDSISSLAVYQWFQNGILLPNQNDTLLKVPSAGLFKLIYSLGSCSFSDSTTVTDPPFLTTKVESYACAGQNVTLSANVTPTAQAPYTFKWIMGGTTLGTKDTITAAVPAAVAPAITDTNYYYVQVTDSLGCISMDSTRVIGIPEPTFPLFITDSSGCQGIGVLLNATATNLASIIDSVPAVYQWKDNGTVLANTTNSLLAMSAGTYVVQLTIDQCVNSDTSVIKINPVPPVTNTSIKHCFRPDNATAYDTLAPYTIGVSPGNIKYQWYSNDATINSNNNDSTLVIDGAGTYYAIITNGYHCSDTSSVQVTEVCVPQVFVPNTFEPGATYSNGMVNKFYVVGNHFNKNDGFSLEVFNRWGEIIFKTTDPSPEAGWDGSFGGEPMPMGEYPCVITYRGDTQDHGSLTRKKASILLIR